MLDVRYSSRFKRDFKTCMKRKYSMGKLQQVIDILRIPDKLPNRNVDHLLTGDYVGYRECHVAPDWLLLYRYEESELFLYRTGTHTDIFGM